MDISPPSSVKMPSHSHCCVPECSNKKNRCKWSLNLCDNGQFKKKRLCGVDGGCNGLSTVCKELSYHRLPSCTKLRSTWIHKIRRVNTPLTPNSYVCGIHFQGHRRQSVDDLPQFFAWSKQPKQRTTRRSLLADAQQSFTCSPEDVAAVAEAQGEECARESSLEEEVDIDPTIPEPMRDEASLLREQVKFLHDKYLEVCIDLVKEKENSASLQDALKASQECCQRLVNTNTSQRAFSFDNIRRKPNILKFYTGLDSSAIDFIVTVVGESATEACRHTTADTASFVRLDRRGRKRVLKPEDELLITLMKLRHDFPEEDLAMRFGVEQSTISRIFFLLAGDDGCVLR